MSALHRRSDSGLASTRNRMPLACSICLTRTSGCVSRRRCFDIRARTDSDEAAGLAEAAGPSRSTMRSGSHTSEVQPVPPPFDPSASFIAGHSRRDTEAAHAADTVMSTNHPPNRAPPDTKSKQLRSPNHAMFHVCANWTPTPRSSFTLSRMMTGTSACKPAGWPSNGGAIRADPPAELAAPLGKSTRDIGHHRLVFSVQTGPD